MPQSLSGQSASLTQTQTLLETLSRAAATAGEYSHRVVTLEHLLYALLDDPDAVSVLKACNVDLPRLKNTVIEFLVHGLAALRSPDHSGSFLSSDVETVIASATAAAEQSGRRQIDGAIVLAAIIGGGGTTAAQILSNFGVTFDEAVNSLRIHEPLQSTPQNTSAVQSLPQPTIPPTQNLPATRPASHVASPAYAPPNIKDMEPTVDDVMASVREIIGATARQADEYVESVQNQPQEYADLEHEPVAPAPTTGLAQSVQMSLEQKKGGIPVGRDSYAAPPPASPPPYSAQIAPSAPAPPPAMPPGAPHPAPVQPAPRQASPVAPQNIEHRDHGQGTLPIGRRQAEAPDVPRSKGMADAGQLVENIPRKMRVAIPVSVEVRVGRGHIQDLDYGMGGASANRHAVGVTEAMTMQLRAPRGGFIIASQTPETQWIDNTLGIYDDDYASWRWTVTPTLRGRKRLQLILSARTIDDRGMVAETAMPEQVITVDVKINYLKTAMSLGGWVLVALAGGVFSQYGEGLMRWVKELF